MFKKYIFLTTILFLGIIACEKEREIIVENPQPPATVELLNTHMSGKISDDDQKPISNATIKVMFEAYILGETKTDDEGKFSLPNQPAQGSKSYIVIEKTGYSPNIFNKIFTQGEQLIISPTLKKLSVDQILDVINSEYKINDDVVAIIPPGIVSGSDAKVKMQFFDLSKESRTNLLAELSSDGKIDIRNAFWIDILDADKKTISWNPSKEVTVNFSGNIGKLLPKEVWYFDIKLARWSKTTTLNPANGIQQLKIKQAGFYAFVDTCLNDQEKPTAYCQNDITALFNNNAVILYAKDFDKGSYDNCDTNLDFAIRKIQDDCMNGSSSFGPSITFCPSEANKTHQIVVKVTDNNNNVDSVIIDLRLIGQDSCSGDIVKPTPYCKTNVDVSYAATGGMIPSDYFDAGSVDNCTEVSNLVFLIKKVQQDICCPNVPNSLSPSLTFCPLEIGTSTEVEIHISDQNGNSDYCTILVNLKP